MEDWFGYLFRSAGWIALWFQQGAACKQCAKELEGAADDVTTLRIGTCVDVPRRAEEFPEESGCRL